MPQIVVIEGPEEGETFDLGRTAVIGRSQDCDIMLSDPEIHDRHLKVSHAGDRWAVAVVGAVRTVQYNGQDVNRSWLDHGDMLELGNTVLLFSQDETFDVDEQTSEERDRVLSTTQFRARFEAGTGQVLDLIRRSRGRKLEGLLRISDTIRGLEDIPPVVDSILRIVFEIFDADRGTVLLLDERTGKFLCEWI